MLTRDQFCRLTGITSEDLKSLNRRDQLPFADGERKRGEYTPYEALLLLFAGDLAEGLQLSRTKAAWVTARTAQTMMHQLDVIADSSRELYLGRASDEILAGVTWHPFDGTSQDFTVYVGTFQKITSNINEWGVPVVRMAFGNASRAATVLRMRAAREAIDIAGLWGANG